jgi:hypothetical protein
MITANGSKGIGSGYSNITDNDEGTITTITGNAIIFASSITSSRPGSGSTNLGTALFIYGYGTWGNFGELHGNFTLWRDITIDEQTQLSIYGTLNIGGHTLQNNGTIIVESGGAINGTVSGNQPQYWG